MSLRSVIFIFGHYKIDPLRADLKYSISNRKYSIYNLGGRTYERSRL
jgi:hypothetical protein